MKKNTLFIILFLGAFIQKPSAQNFPWADSANGGYELGIGPTGYAICTDGSNNVFATGGTSAIAMFSLAKYNLNGLLEWTKPGYPYYNNGVAADHLGNCYTTGYYFFQKYNSNGILMHVDSSSGAAAYYVSCNAITYDGGKYLYITGTWDGAGSGDTVFFGTQFLAASSNYSPKDLFILKCDTAGNTIWIKSSEGGASPCECTGLGINAASNGLIYVTGNFAENAIFGRDTINTSLSQIMAFVACYDSSGNVQWANSTGKYNSSGNSISSDAAGNVYITGWDSSSNCFTAKYRSNGNLVWGEQCSSANGEYFSWGFGISTDSSGTSFITGGYQGLAFGSLINQGAGDINIFMVKYDSSGNAIWGYDPNDTMQNSLNNFGLAVTTDKEGCNFYFSGATQTPARFGNTVINLSQGNEFYVTKLDSGCALVAGIKNNLVSKEKIKVYPNPFTNITTILFNETTKHQVEVEDITGRIVQQFVCSGQQYELSRGSLANGMYFIKVTDEQNNVFVSKILVQ